MKYVVVVQLRGFYKFSICVSKVDNLPDYIERLAVHAPIIVVGFPLFNLKVSIDTYPLAKNTISIVIIFYDMWIHWLPTMDGWYHNG